MKKRMGAVLAAVGLLVLVACGSAPSWGPGAVVKEEPQQVASSRPDWKKDGYRFEALDEFHIRARVLSVKSYSSGEEAKLSPVDLALGWGNMSDETVLAHLKISQSGRWYFYRWGEEGPPLPVGEIVRSSANMHMIPSDEVVAYELSQVRVGDVVTLRGALVSVTDPAKGWHWRSSTSRSDSGAGACELIWVEDVEREEAPVR